ncbi:DNA replication complex GINS protein (PSF2) [Vairimorpha necatrix]|uniref:DNA replication complex GINS protein (PSF2) n=1 Tax=Vairimorpha necatrix TaxID=6039 RepID=A0AAX4JC22_9MICR
MLSPQELKFISTEELLEVEPTSFIPSLSLIHQSYSDLNPLSIINLPLFIALELKKSGLVQIRLPLVYSFEYLSKLLEDEISNQREYINIPSNIFSTGKLIIRHSYNCEKKEECIGLIDKLKETRFKKTLSGLGKMEGRALSLNNLTLFEWYEIKEILVKHMEERRKFI